MLATILVALNFTLPSGTQHRWKEFDPAVGDSVDQVTCSGGPDTLHALQTAFLYRGIAVVDSHSVVGMEGEPDSFVVTQSGTYHVTTRNNVGESCPSPGVTINDTVTGVPVVPLDPVRAWMLFNARGQKVPDFQASGVYFVRLWLRSGAERVEKIHYIRGLGPLEDVSAWYRRKH